MDGYVLVVLRSLDLCADGRLFKFDKWRFTRKYTVHFFSPATKFGTFFDQHGLITGL